MKAAPQINVYYDAECPICNGEVRLYSRMDKTERIQWIRISDLSEAQLPSGKTREDLLGKFHAREISPQPDEIWHIGVDAFARIWKALPGLRHLAFLFRVPGIRQITMLAYRLFLKWQSWHRKHCR